MKVLITGASGQIGHFLIRELLKFNFRVLNFSRHQLHVNSPLFFNAEISQYDELSFSQSIRQFAPDVVVNLASLSSVAACERNPDDSGYINARFPLICAQRILEESPDTYLIQMSSSEMYGGHKNISLSEHTQIDPKSVYGIHKAQAHDALTKGKEFSRLSRTSLVIFNNESFLRSESYASRRIVSQLKKIKNGNTSSFSIGNDQIRRDWNHPSDLARAIRLLIQLKGSKPLKLIIGSGELHSIEDFYTLAAKMIGVNLDKVHILHDANLFRRVDNDGLMADYTLAFQLLGWSPNMNFYDIVRDIIFGNNDLNDFFTLKTFSDE